MRLSLVLATYGRASELGRCLDSLVEQEDRDFELLVMDQNADDRVLEILQSIRLRGLALRHVRLPTPGLSEARNEGLRLASGDVVGFPDDDCWYEPQTVACLRRGFLADSTVSGLVADWVEQTEGAGHPSGVAEQFLTLEAWRNFRGGAASSITLFVKRDLLIELSGFDNRLGVGKWFGAAEETDLVLRALAIGARFKRVSNARVHHPYVNARENLTYGKVESVRARARGTGAIYAKHRLSTMTIARGLAAPVLKPLLRLQIGGPLRMGAAIALGRIEGMLRWRRLEREGVRQVTK